MALAKLQKILPLIVGVAAIFGCTGVRAGPLSICLSASDVSSIKREFFSTFPDHAAFDNYVDQSKFKLLTNVINGAALQSSGRPVGEKIDWLMTTFDEHKPLFENMKGLDQPTFSYIKGELRGLQLSVDNGRTSTHFPKNECVRDVEFTAVGTQCVMSQRLQNLTFSFIKNENRTILASVGIYFIACQDKKLP